MRIHVIAPGFDPAVFTYATGPMFRFGVDKLFSVHTPILDKETEIKVERTLAKVEELTRLKADRKTLHSKTFPDLVDELRRFLNGFGDSDEIYVHLEGGERHVGLAMVYASFFVRKKLQVIIPTEYGKDGKDGVLELMQPIPAMELSDKQREVLRLVASKEGQTLTELAERINKDSPTSVAPGVFRQLRTLAGFKLVALVENGKKTYAITSTGRLFL